MSYFKRFPKTEYDYQRNGFIQSVVNIHKSVRPIGAYLDDITNYTYYRINEGERPDIVSQRIYDNSEYYWTFFVVNEFLSDGLNAWPMSSQQLNSYFARNFNGKVAVTQPTINYDADGNITGYEDNINGDGPNDFSTFKAGEVVQNTDINASPYVEPTATGTISRINVDMNQLVIKPLTGSFTQGDPIVSQKTGKQVRAYRLYDEVDAPFSYYLDTDGDKRPHPCPEFTGDTSDPNNLISTMPYISNRAHIIAQNDARSQIRVISPDFIEDFVEEYFRLINL